MKQQTEVALKEWAVAVQALLQGDQILLLRKGGIIEETRDFQLIAPNFYLFPTYEHQKEHLLKDAYKPLLHTVVDMQKSQQHARIEAYAEAVEDWEIHDEADLAKLAPYHIWTEGFAEERLKWKKKSPLHVLVLRIYRMVEPIVLESTEAFAGCKSWGQLPEQAERLERVPVLSDEEFEKQVQRLRKIIGR